MLFDDLKIKNFVHENELYVSVPDLSSHLLKAIDEFYNETKELSHIVGLSIEERVFITGLINGMSNIVTLLTQSYEENEISQISTVDELLEKFNESTK